MAWPVTLWSPVTITGLIPAATHLLTASATSTLGKQVGDLRHEWIVATAMWKVFNLPPETPTRFRTDDLLMARSLAREGAGICFLPAFTAAPFVREGWLEQLPLADPFRAMKGDLALLYPSSGQVPRKVTAFCGFVLDWARKARTA